VQDMNTPQIPGPGPTAPARLGASSVLYTLVGFVAGCVAMFGSLFLLNADAATGNAPACSMTPPVMSIDGTIEAGLGLPMVRSSHRQGNLREATNDSVYASVVRQQQIQGSSGSDAIHHANHRSSDVRSTRN
jgi:hypothetical protein